MWHQCARLPDCERLAAELLGGVGDRWMHVERVTAVAGELAGHCSGTNLLSAAWLHDIGYAPELVHTGMHASTEHCSWRESARSEVVSLVAFHTCAEFEARSEL